MSQKERDLDGTSGLVYTTESETRMNGEKWHLTSCMHLESAAGRLVGTHRGPHLFLLRGGWTTESARRTIVGWSSFSQGQQKWVEARAPGSGLTRHV